MVSIPFQGEICPTCKGSRLLCGKPQCPILLKYMARIPIKRVTLSTDLQGASPPSFFVGRHSYPNVLSGPMIPPLDPEKARIVDEPDLWYGKPVEELINYRTQLVRTTFRVNVKRPDTSRLLDVSQELVMASKPVETEAVFKKAPEFRIDVDSRYAPMGPMGDVKKIALVENPNVLPVVDRITSDVDLNATSAITELYKGGLTVTQIERMLSAGMLGIKKQRRLVPTRWSITATDDTISKQVVEQIKLYPLINKYQLFESSYLDNHFQIVLLPKAWAFEMLETWHPGSAWLGDNYKPVIVQDHEFYRGRKSYASKVQGAYYAARLAITEYLSEIQRQAAVLIFREVRPGYIVPLGVWQIRENVRYAMKQTPLQFQSLKDILKRVSSKLLTPIKDWLHRSILYDFYTGQKTLDIYS